MLLKTLTAQIGINTNTPTSTLDVRGSLQASFREITENTTLNENDYYITYSGTEDATITLPPISIGTNNFNGRIYRIKNVSNNNIIIRPSGENTIRVTNNTSNFFIVEAGNYIEIVNNNNTSAAWDLSFIGSTFSSNVELYNTTLIIPPFNTRITEDNSDNFESSDGKNKWKVISANSSAYSANGNAFISANKMTIIYEYQGVAFNLRNLHPILTVGNNSSTTDVFTISFGGFSTVNGKTRFVLSVSKTDLIGSNNFAWNNSSFIINALFTKTL